MLVETCDVNMQVMRKLGRLYSEMIFVQGYIHCDPHPGNLLVRPSKTGTEIVLLDHGLYQVLGRVILSSVIIMSLQIFS